MSRILARFFLAASLFGFFIPARAAETLPAQADWGTLKPAGTAVVMKIVDPYSLLLDDGSVIRLTGIDYPDFENGEAGPFATTALRILQDMLEGKAVTIYQTAKKDRGRTNRMGHRLAQLERQADRVWVQGSLVALGAARVKTSQTNPEMADQLYMLENEARKTRTGLWEDPCCSVLTPEQTAQHFKSFQIVEGRVESASINANRIYLNFGRDWRTDFTVSIAPANRRLFSAMNIDPLQWNNQILRVRGWIGEHNGPAMEIDHPQAIEIVEKPITAKARLQETR